MSIEMIFRAFRKDYPKRNAGAAFLTTFVQYLQVFAFKIDVKKEKKSWAYLGKSNSGAPDYHGVLLGTLYY